MEGGMLPRLAQCVAELDVGVPLLAQAWLPRGGVLVQGPSALAATFVDAPALHAFRDACAGARLPLSPPGTTLPSRCYLSQAPDWEPNLERFPEHDARCAEAPRGGEVRAAFAVPVFGGRDGADAEPAAVLELVMLDELFSFADVAVAAGVAAHSAGLRLSFNRAFCFAPATVPPQQSPVLARLASALSALCAAHALPLAQLWVPCLVADDTAPPDAPPDAPPPQPAPAAQLQTRGMPACVATASLWAYRLAACERALQAGQGVAGAAWQARALVWVADAAALRCTANPLRPFAAMLGVAAAAAFCVTGGASEADTYVIEVLFPRLPEDGLSGQLAALARVHASLEAACASAGLRCASGAEVRDVAHAVWAAAQASAAATPRAAIRAVAGAAAAAGPNGFLLPPSFFESDVPMTPCAVLAPAAHEGAWLPHVRTTGAVGYGLGAADVAGAPGGGGAYGSLPQAGLAPRSAPRPGSRGGRGRSGRSSRSGKRRPRAPDAQGSDSGHARGAATAAAIAAAACDADVPMASGDDEHDHETAAAAEEAGVAATAAADVDTCRRRRRPSSRYADAEAEPPRRAPRTSPALLVADDPVDADAGMDDDDDDGDADRPADATSAREVQGGVVVPVRMVDGRVAAVTMADLRSLFHLPLREAARRLGVCGTTLKTVCRRHGLTRWPYRTLAKLNAHATKMQLSVQTACDSLGMHGGLPPSARAGALADGLQFASEGVLHWAQPQPQPQAQPQAPTAALQAQPLPSPAPRAAMSDAALLLALQSQTDQHRAQSGSPEQPQPPGEQCGPDPFSTPPQALSFLMGTSEEGRRASAAAAVAAAHALAVSGAAADGAAGGTMPPPSPRPRCDFASPPTSASTEAIYSAAAAAAPAGGDAPAS